MSARTRLWSTLLRSPRLNAAFVMLAGLLATALATGLTQLNNHQNAREALAKVTAAAADAVVERIRLYQYGLRGVRGAVFAVGPARIDRETFARYSRSLDLDAEFPGAGGFGFIRRVPREDEEHFLQQARADGDPDFAIRQFAPHAREHFVIQYIEPLERNRAAVGLDIASEANRLQAANASLRSGEVRLTGPITLVQATGKPLQSFLILLPVYDSPETPATEAERERRGLGWSYAPLITEDVLRGLTLPSDAVRLSLRDVTDAQRHDEPFYERGIAAAAPAEVMHDAVERAIFGRRWQFELAAYPAFIDSLRQPSAVQVALAGTCLSLLLAGLAELASVNRRRRLQVLATQARLAAIVESSADAIIGKTLDGAVTSWNRGAETIFGYRADEAIGRTLLELIVPADRATEETDLLHRLRSGECILPFDTLRRRKDGGLVHVSVAVSPVYDEHGVLIGISKTARDVSAQKLAEARLQELNARLEREVAERTAELRELNALLGNVLNSASEVSIIATDTRGTIKVFNRGAERLLGYAADEVVDLRTPALIHLPEEVAARGRELSRRYGQAIEGFRVFVHEPERQGSETREWTYVRKDGSRFPVTLVVTAMRNADGAHVGYLGVALDITQRKAAEQRLAVSLETTRAVLDTAVNPVITFDGDGRVHTLNPAAQQSFGYRIADLDGRRVDELIGARSRARFADLITRRRDGCGTDADCVEELWGLRRDGSEFPIQLSIGTMRAPGQPMLVCVVTDLTQQLRLRQEVSAARDQLLLAADVAELGIWSWTPDDNRLQWNARMFELYGQPREPGADDTFDHLRWLSLVHPDDVGDLLGNLDAVVAGRDVANPVFRIVRPDGQVLYLQAGAKAERSAEGKVVKVTGINRDITAQRELEARLREAKEKADAANAAKSSFLANMSHEIRTPLNAVLGMLQLAQGTALDAHQLGYVQNADSAARSLLALLDDILDYSKIEAGKLQLDLQPFEPERLMRDLAVVLAGVQEDKGVEVLYDMEADLPGLMVGDSLRLRQVLINLAGNALKFTLQGRVLVSVHRLAQRGTTVRLQMAVADTGIGIHPEHLVRIFDGFTQAEASTTRRFGGTGLGLAISRRLLEAMGSRLCVESHVGTGSRFWFDLELDVADATPPPVAGPADHRPLSLLVAADDAATAELLCRTAQSLGWQPEPVSAEREAVTERIEAALRRGRPFDLMLLSRHATTPGALATMPALDPRLGAAAPPVLLLASAAGCRMLDDCGRDAATPFAACLTQPATPRQLAAAAYRVLYASMDDAAEMPRYQPSGRLQGLKLLVVEDNALNRKVASKLLAAEGAEVKLAEGGQQGIDAVFAEEPPFDAVLMDIQMPDIDGLEATRRIRMHADRGHLPIIAMTANALRSDRSMCLAAGMNDHIGKPIDMQVLVSTLQQWTGRPMAAAGTPDSAPTAAGIIEPAHAIAARLGGNLPLIRLMLDSAEAELGRELERLDALAGRGDLRGTLALLHGLKGSAGTAGASRFAATAAALEQRLKHADAAEVAVVLADRAGWLADWQALLQQSIAALRRAFPDASPGPDADAAALGTERWGAALQDILDLLAGNNLRAVELARTLERQTPAASSAGFAEFRRAVDALDFPRALQLGRDLLGAARGA
ncbi:multi-sensor hybrid histidine kinase [Plasticicumulans lactativorans]|uniref:Sensory/regulatory protein RpfC n=1 Tax=Plasticicumulans lactativorans TaxID=1133106 RepID=A0A4R2L624_9GAMM|nr:PAS domain S-box protein [Plasticicumulans lactativorans]TCO80727.1 multi-sensor hybrid histidine kinase [Plasticicumulans lactativorans]